MAKKESSGTLRIAIIGSGIGGASCAYNLRALFGSRCEIDVYEKDANIGGRLATYAHEGREYETGGSILHPSNLYMDEFRMICGLNKVVESKKNNYFLGFFDANGLVFRHTSGSYSIIDKLKVIRHFGLSQSYKFFNWLTSLIKDFERIYKLQNNCITFDSIDEFIELLSTQLSEISCMSIRDALRRENFDNKIIDQLANVATLANYGQDTKVNGFVGLVSLAGVSAELWSVHGGNKQIPIKLLELSKARLLLNAHVKSVSGIIGLDKTSLLQGKEKNVVLFTYNNTTYSEIYDYVVVAFPMTKDLKREEFFLNFDYRDHLNCEFQYNQACLVKGSVKLFDGVPKNRRVELFSCDPSLDYRIICTQLPCDYDEDIDRESSVKNVNKVFKTFSKCDLTEKKLKKIFEPDYQLLTKVNWQAFPKYKRIPLSNDDETSSYPSIYIDSPERSRVFYLNSIEWAASCMELCCISARNIALIISKKEQGRRKTRETNKKLFLLKQDNTILVKFTFTLLFISLIILLISYYLT